MFTRVTDFAYVPRDAEVTVSSAEGGRFALCGARATRRLPARYGPAEGVRVELRGAGQASRQINNFCTPATFEADKLIAVEVLTPAANWSSYPPHKHDEERPGELRLEEVYYFEVADGPDGTPGMGYQRVYGSRPDQDIDVTAEVRTGDLILIPHGWHGPAMATPGYDLYYLNVMAGPGAERAWLICDDPAHAWIRGTWEGQEMDPRLPAHHDRRKARPLRTITHWIGGKPASGSASRTSPVWNPATGEQQAEVVLASTADVDEAVRTAARRRSSAGRSRRSSQRTKILFAFRELVNARIDELAEVVSDEHGKVLSDARGEVQRGLEVVEFACGIPTLLKGDFSDQVSTGVDVYSFRQPLGVVAGHHPVQLPGHGPDVDAPGRHRVREHVRAQAQRARPVGVDARRGAVGRGRPARRRVQRRARRQGGRRRAARPPGRRGGVLRRLHADRPLHPRARHGERQAGPGARRGEEPRDRAAGRRPSTSPPTTSSPPRSARPASAAWRSRPRSRSAAAADELVDAVAEKARAVKVGSGRDPASEMGPVVTPAARDRIVGLIGSGEAAGRRRSRSTGGG